MHVVQISSAFAVLAAACVGVVTAAVVPFSAPVGMGVTATGAVDARVVDVDGDGDMDIVGSSSAGPLPLGSLCWYENNGAASPSFTAHTIGVASVSSVPYIDVGDMDGDGDIDVVACVPSAFQAVKLYKNGGERPPTWTTVTIATGTGASFAFLGDVDLDGDLDVITPSTSQQLLWYANSGTGTFSPRVVIASSLGAEPIGVQLADVDRDGDADIVMHFVGGPRWFASDGLTFAALALAIGTVPTTDAPSFRPRVVDVDGDGALDVVEASNDNSVVYVHYKTGVSLAFTTVVVSSAGTYAFPRDCEAVDLDGDGDVDLVLAAATADTLVWFDSDGASPPAFTSRVIASGASSLMDGCRRAVPADVDNDGDLDVVVASDTSNVVTWVENSSPIDRTKFRIVYPVPINSSSVLPRRHAFPVVGDSVTVRLLHVDGGYQPQSGSPCTINGVTVSSSFSESSRGMYSLSLTLSSTALDWPWTGLSVDCTLVDSSSNVVHVTGSSMVGAALRFLGTGGGDGGIATSNIACSSSCVNGSALRGPLSAWLDIDGDGDVDGFTASTAVGFLRLLQNVNSATVVRGSSWRVGLSDKTSSRGVPTVQASAIADIVTLDIEGDGDVDVVVVTSVCSNSVILLNNGAGTFTSVAWSTRGIAIGASTTCTSGEAADVDRDGDVDLFVGALASNSKLLLNNGAGSFSDMSTRLLPGVTGDAVGAAMFDADGDGYVDIFVTVNGGSNRLYENDADGSFVDVASSRGVSSNGGRTALRGVAVGDVDGDGDADMYVCSDSDNRLFVNGGGSSSFVEMAASWGVSLPRSTSIGASLGDVDLDGRVDILVSNSGVQQSRLFLNRGGGVWSDVSAAWEVTVSGGAVLADMDSDGDLDVPSLGYWNPRLHAGSRAAVIIVRVVSGTGATNQHGVIVSLLDSTATTVVSSGIVGSPSAYGTGPYNVTLVVSSTVRAADTGAGMQFVVDAVFVSGRRQQLAVTVATSAEIVRVSINDTCVAGKYSLTTVSPCLLCDAGYACPAGSTSATPPAAKCADGTYAAAGASACSPCSTSPPPGNACYDGAGAASGRACVAGKWSPGGGTACSNCDAGYACPAGSTSATPEAAICPAGRYSVAGATSCSNCDAGYACPAGSTSASPSAAMCPPATFSAAGAASCSPCAANSISGARASSCTTCAEGSPCGPIPVCPAAGGYVVSVYTDTPGYEGGQSSCLLYDASVVSYATAKAACVALGYHLLTTSATVKSTSALMNYAHATVVTNPASFWWMGAERTGSSALLGWSWVDGTSASNLNCGAVGCSGVWSTSNPDNLGGTQDRIRFWPDSSAGNDASSALTSSYVCECEIVCPPGTFCTLNTNAITLCPAGTFSSVSGATSCTNCDAGYACPAGSTSGTPVAAMCPAGKYSLAGATSCSNCDAGYACPSGSTSSTPVAAICPAGKYSVSGATSCSDCDAGYVCPSGSTTASPVAAICPVGKFSLSGATSCSNCDAGYACLAGSTSSSPEAVRCIAGKFSLSGATSCSDCDAGYACPSGSTTASPVAAMCPAGTFSLSGATSCTNCDAGYACPSGSTSATPAAARCPAGKYSGSGATSCRNCDGGYACPPGSTTSSPVDAICLPGTFSVAGAPSCEQCAAGRYGESSGMSSAHCTDRCPNGWYSAAGSTSCSICSAGQYSIVGDGATDGCVCVCDCVCVVMARRAILVRASACGPVCLCW
jgi:hypothetical protein